MNRINTIQIPKEVTKVIRAYIDDFEGSQLRYKMKLGDDYYHSENTEIMSRKMLIYAETDEGVPYETEDPYKSNNKLPAGYFKLLTDQKVNYSLGKDITVEANDPDALNDTLGKGFQRVLKKVATEASKKVVGWLHPYINDKGQFKMMNVPSEQVIPVYQPHDKRALELTIRYYQVSILNEDSGVVRVTRVEVWDEEEVTYYQENDKTSLFYLLDQQEMFDIFRRDFNNPKYHFQKDIKYGQKTTRTEGLAWGMVPFIPLYNNDAEEYDLKPIKAFIDAYDIVNSDFINNLEDFQDIYWILKGYDGTNVSEFLHQVKRYKTLKVSDTGDAKAETIQIPYQARKEAKEGLEQDIFTFGMGVNTNQIGEGNITNVVIKSRFTNLDLKASQFEGELKEFLYTLIDFVNKYREINRESPIEVDDIVFNRSVIMNEVELLKANQEQLGVVSEDTRLANHPWVSDTDEEVKKMKEESEGDIDLDEPIAGDGDEPDE